MIRRLLPIFLVLLLALGQVRAWDAFLATAEFEPRDTAHGFQFEGDLWLSNGWTHNGVAYRDLWRSRDGMTWQRVSARTPYDAYSGIAVHNGAIYAANRTVWLSPDGETWVQIGNTPITRESALPYLRSYNGKLYLFVVEGVWSSPNGITWTEVPTPETLKRGSYAVEEFQGALWIMAGGKRITNDPPESGDPEKTSFNDVWRFTEAEGWHLITSGAPWSARMWPAGIVHKGRFFLVAGYSNRDNANLNDTWVTNDGRNWSRVNFAKTFPPRHWVTLFSRGDDIILAAGNAWPTQNDVWRLRLP